MQRLFVAPADALVDQPLSVRVEGLAPGEQTRLQATFRTWNGRLWRSQGTFAADAEGTVDPDRDAPLAGTWEGAHPGALLWSMQRVAGDGSEEHRRSVTVPGELHIEAEFPAGDPGAECPAGEPLRAVVLRRLAAPSVTREIVQQDGLAGALYLPPGPAQRAVIVLGGSSGEPDFAHAALLASHGFAALALAYFCAPGLPDWLLAVPVERVSQAVGWLRRRTGASFVATWGTSRGAELALLAASLDESIDAVVALAGTGVLVGGFGPVAQRERCEGAAWSSGGRPLPSLERGNPLALATSASSDEAIAETPLFEAALDHAPSVARASIAVERVRGPVLLLAGDDDLCWPADRLSRVAHERLASASRPYPDELRVYPGAGHFLGAPGLPTTTDRYRHPLTRLEYLAGGNPRADAEAAADLWPRALRFLDDAADRAANAAQRAAAEGGPAGG